jgi:hypothetical protein
MSEDSSSCGKDSISKHIFQIIFIKIIFLDEKILFNSDGLEEAITGKP